MRGNLWFLLVPAFLFSCCGSQERQLIAGASSHGTSAFIDLVVPANQEFSFYALGSHTRTPRNATMRMVVDGIDLNPVELPPQGGELHRDYTFRKETKVEIHPPAGYWFEQSNYRSTVAEGHKRGFAVRLASNSHWSLDVKLKPAVYEYKEVKDLSLVTAEELNKQALDGWELVRPNADKVGDELRYRTQGGDGALFKRVKRN